MFEINDIVRYISLHINAAILPISQLGTMASGSSGFIRAAGSEKYIIAKIWNSDIKDWTIQYLIKTIEPNYRNEYSYLWVSEKDIILDIQTSRDRKLGKLLN